MTAAVWALIPAIVLAIVLTATWARVRDNAARTLLRDAMMKVAQ